MKTKESGKSKWIYGIGRILFILLIFASVGIYIYADDYYRPSVTAQSALQSVQGIEFTVEDGDLVFTPENPVGGVVIYPGGRVSERAYGLLGSKIAGMGYKTVIIKAPLKLSILSNQAAKKYVEEEGLSDWVIIGHSLGGVSAARFTEKNPDKIRALVFLAAYPDGGTDLRDAPFKVYSLVGTKDSVIDMENLEEAKVRLPVSMIEVDIRGGNHSSFANYGVQDGDTLPDIGYNAQQNFVLDVLRDAFR
ncbi:alpha/beta fold hydrolase [Proteiniclasticum sp. C24MP]|uniref:alpha/beta fold hydrolase n=1 Tax=Proteiniclasticum sp. C24MP TaxID=3374101 RepID=UPI003754E065